jgi:hypothetical protein
MQASEPGIFFDREKFLAAIHHIIAACSDRPEVLGKTKLHKCLYYSDMLHYFVTGAPITGADYMKAPYGPTARYLDWGINQLKAQGLINVKVEDYFGLGKYTYMSEAPVRTNLLSGNEKALLSEIVAFVCEHSAKEISEFSHSRPWQDVRMGDRIPYASAYQLVPGTTPTAADLEWAGDQEEILQRYRRA